MLVAAPVRARTAGFQPRSWVSTTHPGAQWTARPTNSLRLSVSAVKRSRARKGAENKIQTEKLHPHETDHGAQWAARPTGFVRLSVSAVNQKLV